MYQRDENEYRFSFDKLAHAHPAADCYVIGKPVASVYIDDDGYATGSREDDIASIAISVNGERVLHLTWEQARALVGALERVEGVARNG